MQIPQFVQMTEQQLEHQRKRQSDHQRVPNEYSRYEFEVFKAGAGHIVWCVRAFHILNDDTPTTNHVHWTERPIQEVVKGPPWNLINFECRCRLNIPHHSSLWMAVPHTRKMELNSSPILMNDVVWSLARAMKTQSSCASSVHDPMPQQINNYSIQRGRATEQQTTRVTAVAAVITKVTQLGNVDATQ